MTLPSDWTPAVTKPGVYPELSEAYFGKRLTPTKALTQSGIKILIQETPFDFKNPTEKKSKEMDIGSIAHALALDKGKKYIVSPYDEYRTKEARAWRDDAIAEGIIPIKEKDYVDAKAVADILKAKMRHLLGDAKYETEVPFFWQEGETWCGGMIDLWCEEKLICLDPKLTTFLHGKARNHVINMGYDIQGAWTLRGLGKIFPEYEGRIRFANLLVKPKAPYTSRAVAINEAWRMSAEQECLRALRIFERCMATNEWPAYPDDIEMLDIPSWTLRERIEAEMMSEDDE